MTDPARSYGGNYSPPPHNFSQGFSSPPPGLSYNSPSPPLNIPNPFLPSSIGGYPNSTFPMSMPPSFQPSFSSSSSFLPSSAVTATIPSYVPPPSFNLNPPSNLTFTSFQKQFGGSTPPIKPSFNNPPQWTSSGTALSMTPPGSIPSLNAPTFPRPTPAFNPNPPPNLSLGKSITVNPPIAPGSIPAWGATTQLPSWFKSPSSDYQINKTPPIPSSVPQPYNPTLSSFTPPLFSPSAPSCQSTDSCFSRKIESQAASPPPSLGVLNFTKLPVGHAGLPRTYASLGGFSHLSYGGSSWANSSSSKIDSFTSDRTVAKWTPGFLSTYGLKPPAIDKDPNFQFKMLGKFEETRRFMHQLRAGPEKLFAGWELKAIAPVVIKINPQTTLFVDPFNVTDFFQRLSVRTQETRPNHDDPSRGADRAIALLQSNEVHGTTKYVGIFVKNAFQLREQMGCRTRFLSNSDKMTLSQAWETKAVPAMHQAVDNAFQTNLAENFNPNNDSRMQQFVQDAVFDPLWLMPFGRIAKAMNLNTKGMQFTLKEINPIMKTIKVAAEMPVAMRPAYATAATLTFGKELGFTTHEMVKLQQAGRLEQTLADAYKHIVNTPAMQESLEKFNHAQAFLKPYRGFMAEERCRALMQEAGIRTYPRPNGIPENFRVRISDNGAGLLYVHPEHNQTAIRVMSGKPHSPNLHQQTPYVIHMKNGKYLDKFGNEVKKHSPAAHIPIDEFVFKN